jgi:hypothetical protein
MVGISEEGQREILGLKIALRETKESWKELLRELKGPRLPSRRGGHQRRPRGAKGGSSTGVSAASVIGVRHNILDKTTSGYRDRMHQLLDRMLKARRPGGSSKRRRKNSKKRASSSRYS